MLYHQRRTRTPNYIKENKMGRPLKKSYFGSETVNGESIASITIGGVNNAYIAKPTFLVAAPTLPLGVTATTLVHMGVVGITNFTSGTAITPLQVLTLTGGTAATQGTIRVDTTSLATLVVGASGGTGYTTGDVVTVQGGTGTLGTGTVIAAGGIVSGFSTFTPGSYTVNPVTLTNAATVKVGGGGDDALTVNITMGANTVTLLTAGDYTVLPPDVTIVGSGAGNPLFNLTYKVVSAAIVLAGSGYASVPVVTVSAGNATGVAVLTTGGANAIVAYAYTGGSNKIADIVKQEGSTYYKVLTSDSVVGVDDRAVLQAATPAAVGQMTITAFDEAGETYWVTKLTMNLATLVRNTGSVYANNTSVQWSFAAAVDATPIVQIQNA